MFISLGRTMDRVLDDVVPLLLKKAGEVSNAGGKPVCVLSG